MLFAFFMTVCLQSDPQTCETLKAELTEAQMRTCEIDAAAVMPRWSEDHPGYEIVSWKCSRKPAA